MKYFVALVSLLIIFGCSKTPSDVPIDSYRNVEINVDMNKVIDDGLFDQNVDILTLLLDSVDEFEMHDENDDNIFTCIISNLILGRIYEYQYAINDIAEDIEETRSFTVQGGENIVANYYGELDPTIVIFLVNMSYQIELGNFNPDSDFLDVAGTFNNWDGTNNHLIEIDNYNGQAVNYVYKISFTNFDAGDTIEFKFRINGSWDTSEDFGLEINRVYTIEQGENSLVYWYNDDDDD